MLTIRLQMMDFGSHEVLAPQVGAKARDILSQFLVEAVTLSLAGRNHRDCRRGDGVFADLALCALVDARQFAPRSCWRSYSPRWSGCSLATIQRAKRRSWTD